MGCGHLPPVAKPAPSALSEDHHVHGGEASAGNDLGVWHFVAPADTEDATKAAQVETIQRLLLFGIC